MRGFGGEGRGRQSKGGQYFNYEGRLQVFAIPDASASVINIVATNFNLMEAAIEYIWPAIC